ncbi:MAG: 2-hydroxyacid dehydrogenase [Planctomycetota bacterium]
MRVAAFSVKPFEREPLEQANKAESEPHELVMFEHSLDAHTAELVDDCRAVCCFVSDTLDAETIGKLADRGVELIALRSAGFNHVDLDAADRHGMTVARVPAYSPYAVAEHTAALILSLNRHIPRAVGRVREHNFSLNGLLGFDLHGKTVGVVGTGKIGVCFIRIMAGFGCRVIAHDPNHNPEAIEAGAEYVGLEELLSRSDIVSLHCPLTPETKHLIDDDAFANMKEGVMLVNTGRGALIDTKAAIRALKSRRLGSLALDVYEEEEGIFFNDLSDTVLQDDVLARLLTFPNVMVTSHQAFFTREALANIMETTVANLTGHERREVPTDNLVPKSGS